MKVMLLAGGLGKRLHPLTEKRPKSLLEVGGRPLLQYHLERLAAAGFRHVVLNLAWHGSQIEAWLGSGARFGLQADYAREPEPSAPLGTGGGIRHALPLLGEEPFLVVNADIWTDYPFAKLAAAGLGSGDLAFLVMVPLPAGQEGDFALADSGRILPPGKDGPRLTFSGISLLSPALFASCSQERFPLRALLLPAIRSGRAGGHLYRGEWWDAGTPDSLAALDARLGGAANP